MVLKRGGTWRPCAKALKCCKVVVGWGITGALNTAGYSSFELEPVIKPKFVILSCMNIPLAWRGGVRFGRDNVRLRSYAQKQVRSPLCKRSDIHIPDQLTRAPKYCT